MTIEQIVEQVYDKVKIRLEILQYNSLPKILVISKEREELERFLTFEKELRNICDFAHSLDFNNKCDLTEYECIIVTELNNEYLAKLSGGFFETPHLKLISQAVMAGKKIFLPEENIEFLQYEKTAPMTFTHSFSIKLNRLKSWKIVVKPKNEIIKDLEKQYKSIGSIEKDTINILGKRVITLKDVSSVMARGSQEITILDKSIITDVALEFIRKNKIKINKL